MSQQPFTPQEQEVFDHLLEAHNKFVALERTHPMEVQEWVASFHHLQDLMISRIVRRDYPEHFPTYISKPKDDPTPNGGYPYDAEHKRRASGPQKRKFTLLNWILSVAMVMVLWVAFTMAVLRFRHPELTDTQLFTRIPQAFICNFK